MHFTLDLPPATTGAAPTPTTVAEIVARVRDWIVRNADCFPGFCGAHLVGGITRMPPEALFPAYRDVDLVIVLHAGAYDRPNPEDHSVDGLILEVGFRNVDEYASPAVVLADPTLANLAYAPILTDPLGILSELQYEVAREFARPKWVRARCLAAQGRVGSLIGMMRQAPNPVEAIGASWHMWESLTEVLAMARLRAGTYRRTFTLLKELLQQEGRVDLHEAALTLLGSRQMSRAQVEAYLHESALLFDRALEVKSSPGPYTYKLHAYVRPYLVEGAQEMVDEGNHREALYWILATHVVGADTLARDAPEDERPEHATRTGRMIAELGWLAPEERDAKALHAQALAQQIFALADRIVDAYEEAWPSA